ncbi:hypothetical protein STIAU_1168 [Stigmatella aurantiaca DW4/3-1]|uniref:Uncharacterized protein n=1 Tax=Stigmatella aurantiaca (strain DW4/3-1) TaxID=378806 RepID=Q08XH8_STIAD|nr:hypothetical protein STIAU_1168 [Stigmatella aurantiaca DW4/3-1]
MGAAVVLALAGLAGLLVRAVRVAAAARAAAGHQGITELAEGAVLIECAGAGGDAPVRGDVTEGVARAVGVRRAIAERLAEAKAVAVLPGRAARVALAAAGAGRGVAEVPGATGRVADADAALSAPVLAVALWTARIAIAHTGVHPRAVGVVRRAARVPGTDTVLAIGIEAVIHRTALVRITHAALGLGLIPEAARAAGAGRAAAGSFPGIKGVARGTTLLLTAFAAPRASVPHMALRTARAVPAHARLAGGGIRVPLGAAGAVPAEADACLAAHPVRTRLIGEALAGIALKGVSHGTLRGDRRPGACREPQHGQDREQEEGRGAVHEASRGGEGVLEAQERARGRDVISQESDALGVRAVLPPVHQVSGHGRAIDEHMKGGGDGFQRQGKGAAQAVERRGDLHQRALERGVADGADDAARACGDGAVAEGGIGPPTKVDLFAWREAAIRSRSPDDGERGEVLVARALQAAQEPGVIGGIAIGAVVLVCHHDDRQGSVGPQESRIGPAEVGLGQRQFHHPQALLQAGPRGGGKGGVLKEHLTRLRSLPGDDLRCAAQHPPVDEVGGDDADLEAHLEPQQFLQESREVEGERLALVGHRAGVIHHPENVDDAFDLALDVHLHRGCHGRIPHLDTLCDGAVHGGRQQLDRRDTRGGHRGHGLAPTWVSCHVVAAGGHQQRREQAETNHGRENVVGAMGAASLR